MVRRVMLLSKTGIRASFIRVGACKLEAYCRERIAIRFQLLDVLEEHSYASSLRLSFPIISPTKPSTAPSIEAHLLHAFALRRGFAL
jgi:hypothetical protein